MAQSAVTPSMEETPVTGSNGRLKNNKKFVVYILAVVIIFVIGGIVYEVSHKTNHGTKTVLGQNTAPAEVDITAGGFVPSTISVKVGQAVVWTSKTGASHIVASDPYPTDSILPNLNSKQPMGSSDAYSYIFKLAGTYTYHDDLNPSLEGTVIVN